MCDWEKFATRMAEHSDLSSAVAILSWDQETYMPPKGMAARAEQLATLQGIVHERLIDPELGDLMERLGSSSDISVTEQAQLREFTYDRNRAIKVPIALVKEIARSQSVALSTWHEARKNRDFRRFAPSLQRLIELRREMADAYGAPEGGERYDALLEGHEKGMRVAQLVPLFATLRDWLVPAVQKLTDVPAPAVDFLEQPFDTERQWQFTLELLDAIGFDKGAGRQDRSVHPFTTSFDPKDVRITTHIFEQMPLSSVFSTIHEAGHALYEQGLPVAYRRTSLCGAASMGLHESQSRLWENMVGRSRPFWEAFFPRYQQLFSGQLANVSLSDFYAAVNRIARSPIRVEADEVTYNLHIFVRFELELMLLRDELSVAELPAAWNERYRNYLGIEPVDDVEGVLQDIHWAWGEFGYFPTYTIGNLYSASLFEAAQRELPDLFETIRHGQFEPLRNWLRLQVHQWGRMEKADTIVRRTTGQGLNVDTFIAYLAHKYEPLYGVRLHTG